jgi:hypothetical protein
VLPLPDSVVVVVREQIGIARGYVIMRWAEDFFVFGSMRETGVVPRLCQPVKSTLPTRRTA